jgi:transposase
MSAAASISPEKMGRDAARRRVDDLQNLLAHVHKECTREAEAARAADNLATPLQAKISQLETQLRIKPHDKNACGERRAEAATDEGSSPQAEPQINIAAVTTAEKLSRDAARARVIELEKALLQAKEELARETVARRAAEDRASKLQARLAYLETLLRLGPDERVAYLDKKLTTSEATCTQKDALLSDVQNRCAFLEDVIKTVQAANADLQYRVDDLLRDKHEPKSEQLTAARRKKLGIPDGQTPPAAPPSDPASTSSPDKDPAKPTKRRRPANGGGRRPKKGVTSVRVQVIDVPEDQRAGKTFIRNEIRQELCHEPAHYYWLQTIRPIYADPNDREKKPVIAPLPPQVIPKAVVGVSTIVRIIIGKYLNHEPLYRQVQIDLRLGVEISRAARSRYVEATAELLRPVYDMLTEVVILSYYMLIDETFLKFLYPDSPEHKGAAHTGYLWGFYAPYAKAVVMEFSTSRSAEVVLKFLPHDWAGVAHTDGYSGYTSAFAQMPRVVHVECWNHLRRYLLRAIKAGHKEAIPLLVELDKLYAIEREARTQKLTTEQRGKLREAKATPVLEGLKSEFLKLQQREEPFFGHLKEAVTYATNRWEHLTIYAKPGYGYVEIDQTAIERAWRPEKVGLKNYLFIGHPDAGWRSAMIYSIIETCKLVGVNPEEYLLWVLPKLAARPRSAKSAERAKGLLPHDFKRLKDEMLAAARARRSPPQHPGNPFCSGRPFSGHRRYRKAHRTRDGNVLAA